MKAIDLRELTALELEEKLAETKAELFNLRFQLATNQLDDASRIREVRKDVARILTVMREQEIQAWREQATAEEGV
ncbi:MAG: 50S ribosomal protein L29 [Gammaproteobacteria bacterium]|nr:50S ribosomal protein L29 [Gammaproteobacteria bacterium]